jgi:predicted GTPase
MQRKRVVIIGAAGRDFHNFNVRFRDREEYEVVAFTATQIPNIEGRMYPPALAGSLYPDGIPILPEEELELVIKESGVDWAVFSYSDISHVNVMHLASRTIASGASFVFLGHGKTAIESKKPVIAVCAARTGCGKSQTTRAVARILKDMGKRIAVVRHPMPYGHLEKQAVQRFASYEDLDLHRTTIEEREEYEPHIDAGNLVFAGVDYGAILKQAEEEADVVLWDGGNNDTPFFKADLHITILDALRPGHSMRYHPGEVNLRLADVLIINKVDSADPDDVKLSQETVMATNPGARVMFARSPVTLADTEAVRGKRVLVVEDGPTVTHGGMAYGAGYVAATAAGAAEIVDPRAHAVGSIKNTFDKYKHLTNVLPAMGYGGHQVRDLEATIRAVPCDVVVTGTPIDIGRVLDVDKPVVRARYELEEVEPGRLMAAVERVFS